jgi:polar amino acid transport system substrate-binding protein
VLISSLPRRSAVAVLAGVALVVSGCGGDSEATSAANTTSESRAPAEADDDLAAMVPEDIAEDGVLSVGSDTTYPPGEFLDEDGETIVGFDVDLFKAVAQKLGLEAEFETAPFDSIIAGVGSGRYEVGVSSFTINRERLEQATMVSYFNAGTQWAAKADNPEGVDPESACGLSIAVQKGTVQVDDLTARSEECEAAGEEPITIDQYEGQDEATAAVVSGKDAAVLADSPVMAYAVEQTNGRLELVGDIYDAAPYGYVVAKEQTDLAQAIAGAVAALIEDGTYESVLAEWGVEAGGIDAPTVNPTVG